MRDCLAWGVVLSTLVLLTLLLHPFKSPEPNHSQSTTLTSLTASSFVVYAFAEQNETSTSEEGRNPFRYAPVSEEGQFDKPMTAMHQASMNFPLLAVEGVLLRHSGKQAFVRYESHRRAVAEGEEIVDGFTVETIDEQSMVVSNLWGKSRRYYVMPSGG